MSFVKRKYVIPGEVIIEGNYRALANVLRAGDKFYSTRVGMAEVGRDGVRVIPLSGPYVPREDDLVIGKIVDYSAFAWEVDINSCFFAFLPAQNVFGRDYSPAKDSMTEQFSVGEMITAKVAAYDRTRDPLLTISGPGLGKIPKGEIIRISPSRVPRLIGKRGSMIKTIESSTGCRLIIGQNGLVVCLGSPEGVLLARKVIKLVEEEAHTADLTQRVQMLLTTQGGT